MTKKQSNFVNAVNNVLKFSRFATKRMVKGVKLLCSICVWFLKN